jgi:TolA-binding protein
MVEAGRKQLNVDESALSTNQELRQQLANLQNEVQRQQERNEDLERQLQQTTHTDICSFIDENPGSTTPQIIQHIADSVPSRVAAQLDALEGTHLRREGGQYYLTEDDDHDAVSSDS